MGKLIEETIKGSWLERSFKWIDRYESESTRRIIQGVISALIGAAILGTLALIWSQRDCITQGSKSIWNLLRYPIQLQVWIATLSFIVSVWCAFLFRRIFMRPLPQSEEFLSKLAELNKQISELKTQDPKFIEILNYVIDDKRTHGLRTIVERCIGSVDKAVPLIQQSETFGDFLNNAGVKLDVNENVKQGFQYPLMNGQQTFAVPTPNNPLVNEWATFTTESNGMVHMNTPAHRHFDWSYFTFKKQFDIKFQTPKGVALLQASSKASYDIQAKYIPVLNSYRNCVPLINDNDTDARLEERRAIFFKALAELSNEMQIKEMLIDRKDKLKNLHQMLSLIWHYVHAVERFDLRTKSFGNRPIPKVDEDLVEGIRKDIDETENKLFQLEPRVKRDFEYLVSDQLPPPLF